MWNTSTVSRRRRQWQESPRHLLQSRVPLWTPPHPHHQARGLPPQGLLEGPRGSRHHRHHPHHCTSPRAPQPDPLWPSCLSSSTAIGRRCRFVLTHLRGPFSAWVPPIQPNRCASCFGLSLIVFPHISVCCRGW
jgi:hypothetical protein